MNMGTFAIPPTDQRYPARIGYVQLAIRGGPSAHLAARRRMDGFCLYSTVDRLSLVTRNHPPHQCHFTAFSHCKSN